MFNYFIYIISFEKINNRSFGRTENIFRFDEMSHITSMVSIWRIIQIILYRLSNINMFSSPDHVSLDYVLIIYI
jgi:hypothetical protein